MGALHLSGLCDVTEFHRALHLSGLCDVTEFHRLSSCRCSSHVSESLFVIVVHFFTILLLFLYGDTLYLSDCYLSSLYLIVLFLICFHFLCLLAG